MLPERVQDDFPSSFISADIFMFHRSGRLKDGRKIINVGATPQGNITLIDFDSDTKALTASTAAHV